MKKIIFVAAVALALCSCAKTELTGVDAGEMIIGASMEAYSSLTKAALADAGSFTWQTGDAIGVATSNGHADFSLKTGEGTASATFSAIYSGTLGNYAVYPADIFVSDSKIKVPASRVWSEGNTNCSMFGNLSEGNVAFKHLGGVVKVTLNGVPADAKKFVFSTPGKKITGEFDIKTGTGTDTNNYIGTADDSGNANSSYTLSFTLNEAKNMAFYIPVPCGTYPKFAFKVLGAEDVVLNEFEGSSQQVVNRKDILIMPTLTIGTITGDGDDAEQGAVSKTVPSGTKGNYRLPAAEKVILNFEGEDNPTDADVINLVYDGDSHLPTKLWLRVATGKKVNVSGNLSDTHVEFDQGEMINVSVLTSQNTFKIIAPAKISEKLVVKGGNVEISGPIEGANNVKAIEVEAGATADGTSAPVQITLENQATVGAPGQSGESAITTSANVVIVNNTTQGVNVTAPETVQVASAGTGSGEVKKNDEVVTTKPAAAIGTQNFITLGDAIKAVKNNETIVMLQNEVFTKGQTVTLENNEAFTLDLNGKTISIAETEFDFSANGTNVALRNGVPQRFAIVVNGKGTMNICDNSEGSQGKIETKNNSYGTTKTILVDGNAIVNVNSGTISADYAPFYVVGYMQTGELPADAPNPTLNVNGGKIIGTDYGIVIKGATSNIVVTGGSVEANYTAISTNGTQDWYNGGNCKISISGGTIKSTSSTDGSAMYLPAKAETIITGGLFEGADGISVKGGSLSISGDAVVKATGPKGDPGVGSSGAKNTGSAIYVEDTYSNHVPSVNISGGKFSSDNNKAVEYFTNKAADADDKGKVTLTGGLYSDQPEAFLIGANYEAVSNGDETYKFKVQQKSPVAQIGSTKYFSLAEAVAAVKNGDVLTLTSNVTLSEKLLINGGKDFTLDLGGKTLTGRVNVDGAKLVVKNGTIDAGTFKQALNFYGSKDPKYKDDIYTYVKVENDVILKGTEGGLCFLSINGSVYYPLSYGVKVDFYGKAQIKPAQVSGNIGYDNYEANIGNVDIYANLPAEISSPSKAMSLYGPIVNIYGEMKNSSTDNEKQGFILSGMARVNVYEGALIEGAEGIGMKSGNLHVYGGTIKSTGAKIDPVEAVNSGAEASGAAISITSSYTFNLFEDKAEMLVNIEGGDLQAINNSALLVTHSYKDSKPVALKQGVDLAISGGKFTSGSDVPVLFIDYAAEGDEFAMPAKFISGGLYNKAPEAGYIADDKKAVQDTQGYWKIVEK